MALSSLSVMGSMIAKSTPVYSILYSSQQLSTTSFTTNTRTDANYGLITIVASATSGLNTSYGIVKMLDNDTLTGWQSISSDYINYYDESGTSINFQPYASSYTGGEFSDSNNSTYAQSTGYYYGIKVSGVQTRFSTTYLDLTLTSQTVYGPYITVFFGSTVKALLKSMTIGGMTSSNWDDLPRGFIILGSNDGTNWNLIKDATDFGSVSPWSGYLSMSSPNGYKNSSGTYIPYNEYTYNISTASTYRYLRFVVTRLIRGRVLSIWKFNLSYDIYKG